MNPYQSPVTAAPGEYDHSLFRRIVRACIWLCVAALALDLFAAVAYTRSVNPIRCAQVAASAVRFDFARLVQKFGKVQP